MNRIFSVLFVFAALLGLGGCMQEPLGSAGVGQGGPPVAVTFEVGMRSALTKADSTPFDNASGTYRLYVAAFNKADGSLAAASLVGGEGYEPVGTISDGSASISLRLPRSQEFRVIFFAEKENAYDVVFADGPQAAFSLKTGLKANDPAQDAFYSVLDVTASKTSYDVTLKRPFAQLNVLVPQENIPEGQTAFRSSLSVQAPTSFDLYNGAAGATLSVVEFAENAISAEPFGKYADAAKPYKWIGTAYVLVPASGKVDVKSFREAGMEAAVAPGLVPVRANGRTNLVGNLYGNELMLAFTVQIGSGFDSSTEDPVNAEDTEITIAGGDTFTEDAPLVIDASAATASGPVNVTLRVNGDDFATVNAGAPEGEQVTAVSEDTEVATATVSGNDVVITPVGNGTTTVVVSTPAYTKATYKPQTFRIPVRVEGVSPTPPAPVSESDTIVFGDLGLENGVQYDSFEEGDMSVTFEGGNNDGKYYNTGAAIRIYGGGSVTVSSDRDIASIEYVFDGDYCPDDFTIDDINTGEYDLDTHIWTGSANEVVLTRADGAGHWRLKQVTVYYDVDNTQKILEKTELGCYLSGHTRSYAAGTDQYVREYDGTALTFVLLKPADDEQLVLSGFADTMQVGDAVTMTLDWKKGTTRLLAGSYAMSVVAIDNRKVWIADKRGNGFVIKK